MAYEGALKTVPGLVAGADLSSAQFRFGKINTSGKVVVATAAGEYCDGVIQNDPDAADKAVTLANGGVTKLVAGGAVTAGDRIMTDANGAAITAAAAPTAATKTSSVGPFNLTAGDTMVIDVDDVGNATATFDAAGATITDTTTYPVADQDTKTMTITITGGTYDGEVQTVTFSGATTTAAQVAAGINAQALGVSAAVVGGQVKLTTDGQGTDFDIATGAGTGNLTWAASVAGTGDVGDIDAVTNAEIETVIEADTTALVTANADGSFTVVSPSTGTDSELDFISGNALTKTGLSVETITGANPGTYSRGRALASATSGDIFSAVIDGPTLN
jgi:hypothetical protein